MSDPPPRAAEHPARLLPVEIGFLADHGVPPGILREAFALARACGVTADEALLREGLLDAEIFYRALARETGLPFLSRPRLIHARFPESLQAGLAALHPDHGEARFVMVPRGAALATLLARPRRRGLAITSPGALREAVMRESGRRIAQDAAHALPDAHPHLSSRGELTLAQSAAAVAGSGAVSFLGTLAPVPTLIALSTLFGTLCLGAIALRIAAVLEPNGITPSRRASRRPDDALPVYTVMVALYREERVVPRLVEALRGFDYPLAKLDIKLLVEDGDWGTQAAIEALALPDAFEMVVVPPGAPRTKPRALNVGLALARGAYTTVYDAEDVPDPGQLRLAVETFARARPEVACLQARLVIDNTGDGWLTRFFTIEYAALFDGLNPGLAALDLPVPLGGTSNHFRTEVLRGLMGWDAWNVTEDADLGIRLALAGYRVMDLPSTTLEEAPAAFGPWLRQRTRWMKGYMQTCLTHSQRPLWALGRLGPFRFLAAVAVTFGTVAAALVFPAFTTAAVLVIASGALVRAGTPAEALAASIGLTTFAAGLAAMLLPPFVGLKRRGWIGLMPWVPLMPVYFCLVSLAAWRGFVELLLRPSRWHKTEHGLARTSRTGRLALSFGAAGRPRPPLAGGEGRRSPRTDPSGP